MKIVTWNCQQAFERKAGLIFSSSPDIAVIQECSKKSTESPFHGYVGEWVGDISSRGLGVFCREDWSLRRLVEPKESDPRWVVPFRVHGSLNFTLIAVWACAIKGNRRESYVGQMHRALETYPRWFSEGPVVVAGDFNSNAVFDQNRREGNHSMMVDELKRRGLESAYHAHDKQEHGVEKTPTFHLYRRAEKPFHFDYIFIPIKRQQGMTVEIGSHNDWASESDHCPLTVEISLVPPGVE